MSEKNCILIVDDDEGVRKSLTLILKKKGYLVESVATGKEALAIAQGMPVSLTLLDVKLPDIMGTQLLAPLKQTNPDMSIIMITGFASVENAVQSLTAGASGYITKPIDLDNLLARIKTTLDQQHLVTEVQRAEAALQESEERLRTILDSMQTGIIVMDADTHTILDANQKSLDMIGETKETVLGSVCHSYICPAEMGKCPITDLAQTIDNSERVLISAQGKKIPILKSVIPTILGGKKVLVESIIDITERKQAEDLLRESEEQYRSVVEGQIELISRFTPDGIHVFVNDAYLLFFGKTREELIGHRFFPSIPKEDADPIRRHFASLIKDHPSATIEHRIIMPDGQIRWQQWSDLAIFNEQGHITEYQSIGKDITERKLAEDALTLANIKLNLLSSITRHDINSQLMALNVYISLSEDAIDNPVELKKSLDTVQKIADSIAHQIGFTRNYEDLGVKAPAWQNVNQIIKKVITQLPMRNVHVDAVDPDLEIFADPLLEKVFYNLTDNALCYGGELMTAIRVTNHEDNGMLVIVMEDDGIGVSTDDKKKLFTKGFGKHTGFGLYLSCEVLSITNLSITETGIFGQGARFEITVPKGKWRIIGKDRMGD